MKVLAEETEETITTEDASEIQEVAQVEEEKTKTEEEKEAELQEKVETLFTEKFGADWEAARKCD